MNELMITQAQHLQQSLYNDLVPLLNIHPAAFLCVFFLWLYGVSRLCEGLARDLQRWWLRKLSASAVFKLSADLLAFLLRIVKCAIFSDRQTSYASYGCSSSPRGIPRHSYTSRFALLDTHGRFQRSCSIVSVACTVVLFGTALANLSY